MPYRLINTKFGSLVMQLVIGLLIGVLVVGVGKLIGIVFPEEAGVVASLIALGIAFLIVVALLGVFLYFMPRIYLAFIPLKLLAIVSVVIVMVNLFNKTVIAKWETEFYPVLSANPDFLTACIVGVIAIVVVCILMYVGYVSVRRKAALKVEQMNATANQLSS